MQKKHPKKIHKKKTAKIVTKSSTRKSRTSGARSTKSQRKVQKKPSRKIESKRPIKKLSKKITRVIGKVSETNAMEKASRIKFQQMIHPWNCVNIDFDNGNDFYVELISKSGEDGLVSDHRTILVQHKSENNLKIIDGYVHPKPVETKKILQWYYNNTQIPYLFVVNDYPSNKFYYVWIDSQFIEELETSKSFWSRQKTISFKIPEKNVLSQESQIHLKKYVFSVKPHFKKIVEPGTFFKMREKVNHLVIQLSEITKGLHFETVTMDVNEIAEKTENALYRIAITGLSRYGKSSLINNLIKRKDVSPTDVWQTTGVPIQIHPSEEEKVIVNFLNPNSKPIEFEFSQKAILEYATRKHNRDNRKGVRDVCVYINSNQLEKGVMFYDIPGLDDPNDEIMGYAYHTADCANALIYLIDGSSAAFGSFVFSNQYKTHINKFSASKKDKIFLVINKVDALSLEKLRELKKEISDNLEIYDLKNKVHEKIYYLAVSPNQQENYQRILPEINTVEELENDLWRFMLAEDRVGIFRLCMILEHYAKIIKQLNELLILRSLDSKRKKQLRDAVNKTSAKVPVLGKTISDHQKRIHSSLEKSLELRKETVLIEIERRLRAIRPDSDLPSDDVVKGWGVQLVIAAIRETNNEFALEMNRLKEHVDQWIEDNIQGVREAFDLTDSDSHFDINYINSIELPKLDFSDTFLKTFLGALLGGMISPMGVLVFGTTTLIMDLILGKEHRRNKKINQTIEKLRKVYEKGFSEIQGQYQELIRSELNKLIDYGNKKLKSYFNDVERQIADLKLPNQIDYSLIEEQLKRQLTILDAGYGEIAKELTPYAFAIRPSV